MKMKFLRQNDVNVLNTNHFEDIVAKSQGKTLTLTLRRNNEEIKTKINAEKNERAIRFL